MFPFLRKKQLPAGQLFSRMSQEYASPDSCDKGCDKGTGTLSQYCDRVPVPLSHSRQFSNDQACLRPWHFLYFLPEPQGQGSLGMIFLAFLL